MKIKLEVTPAQLRMINTSLAREEAEDHSDDPTFNFGVMERTRRVVWDTLVKHNAVGDDND